MLEVSVQVSKDTAVITLRGRFDGLGAQLFDQQVNAGVGQEKTWVLDFREVNYLSSAGIRSLIKYGKQLKKLEGKIILCSVSDTVRTVLETTGVLALFKSVPDLDTAWDIIRQGRSEGNGVKTFAAFGRECAMQIFPTQNSLLEIWGPEKHGSQNLATGSLIAAGHHDLQPAFGIGAMGADEKNAREALGAFISLNRIIGVLPADGFNQPDFMIDNNNDTIVYLASAAVLNGPALARIDINEGSPLKLKDLQEAVFAWLQEFRPGSLPLWGVLAAADLEAGRGGYYSNLQDLAAGKKSFREFPGKQTMIWLGLGGKAPWPDDEKLAAFLEQSGVQPHSGFLLGNALILSKLLDWEIIEQPEEIWQHLSAWDMVQDVLMVDGDIAVKGARLWLWTPEIFLSGQEKLLKIELVAETPFPLDWEIITRKLYADASRVVLDPLTGGFSEGKPFQVAAYDKENRRMLPTVLKLGPRQLIEREINNHRQYVLNYILNNSTTIMGQANSGDAAGMRFNFLGINGPDSKLSWLTSRYQESGIEELKALFDRIFTYILKPWYGQPNWETMRLYREHNPLRRFPDILAIAEQEMGISADAATMACPELGAVLPNPYYFLKHEYPAREGKAQLWYSGINHGDLNMQNILLDERDNIYIIDFSETGSRNIVSDFARLEPIFKFEMTRLVDEQDLKDFLEFERSLARLDSLDQMPEWVYRGADPSVRKAYEMVCLIRKYAKTVVIFETDMIPYLLAMLEWTYPIVMYRQITPMGKKMAVYSAALMVEQIMRIERAGTVPGGQDS